MTDSAVDINNLTVKFGSHTALERITVEIAPGRLVAIVGPNGSGKTTLLKTLLGLVKIDSGEISVFGKPLKEASPSWFGYVPQIKTLDRSFPAIPLELVASGIRMGWSAFLGSSEKKLILQALEQVGAKHIATKPLNTLSGGELQRVYLARSIVRKPKLLLLDEPATGIDMVCEKSINTILQEYTHENGATIIMVTHNWATAHHHAELVLLLNRRQVSYGPPELSLSEENLKIAFTHVGMHHEDTGDPAHV